ncbi:MAG: hypothetical protein QOE70_336 [Chthoniobacter sp.]|jgi:hypothetical protein|nr:hypothetical protein [Chthoniobacter sp.]
MKLLALLLLSGMCTVHALDFVPTEVKVSGEGGQYTYLQFRDGKTKVGYLPPASWTYKGGGGRFCLVPPEVAGAEIDFRVLTLPPALTVEPANLQAFANLALEAVPNGANKVELLTTVFNPLEIDSRKSIEITLGYNFFGQSLKASHLYIVRGQTLLLFRVAAQPADFERLRKTFQASLHTLAGL